MKTQVLQSNSESLKTAGNLLKNGEAVVFPTDTLYGLGADPFSEAAISKIYKAKQRDLKKPILLLVGKHYDINLIAETVPDYAKKLIEKFWPGALTLIFKSKIKIVASKGEPTVGVRMPDDETALALLDLFDKPIATTSANKSGHQSPTSAQEAYAELQGRVPLIVDAGPSKSGVQSTIVDCSGSKPVVLRQGAIKDEDIFECTEENNGT